MGISAGFSTTASLLADPARALMLQALLDGRALPAGDLAFAAGVTPQTASSHLGKLLDGGLLVVEATGRHRYFRLAGSHVAEALEQLATLDPVRPVGRRAPSREAETLRFCRCCFDHLAGQVGVGLTRALIAKGFIATARDRRFDITPAGVAWFGRLGIDVAKLKAGRLGVARQCLDWTERHHHLAGPLGVALLAAFCERGWMRRSTGSRAVDVTPAGWLALRRELGVGRALLVV